MDEDHTDLFPFACGLKGQDGTRVLRPEVLYKRAIGGGNTKKGDAYDISPKSLDKTKKTSRISENSAQTHQRRRLSLFFLF